MTIEALEKKIKERVVLIRKATPHGTNTAENLALDILENQADLAKMIRNIKEGLSRNVEPLLNIF